jgi:hypothetical protein
MSCGGFGVEFGFGGFAAFGDEVIAGFAADERDGAGLREVGGDAVEAAGLAVGERGGVVDFPEDAFGTTVGGAADALDEGLGAIVADAAGEAIHAGLAVELVAEVFDVEGAFGVGFPEADAGGVEQVEGGAEVVLGVEREDPAATEVGLAFGEAVFAVFRVGAEVARGVGAVVVVESAEGGLAGEVGIGLVGEEVSEFADVFLDFDLSDAVDAAADGVAEVLGLGHGGGLSEVDQAGTRVAAGERSKSWIWSRMTSAMSGSVPMADE